MYFLEGFTLLWPLLVIGGILWTQEETFPSGLPSLWLLLLYVWEPHWAQSGKKRRRNRRRERWIQLKDPAVWPSEPWESLILFLMYSWSPHQHISLTNKSLLKNVGNRWREKFGKGQKGTNARSAPTANIMCCFEPFFLKRPQCCKSLLFC